MPNFASFDLNLLRVMDVLLTERSTVKAAQRLGLSQPAVSAALRRLRAAWNDDLFFRRAQGLEPTEFALALETPLREAINGLEALIRGPTAFDPTVAETSFRLSGSDFFDEMLMPRLAARFSRIAPGVRVHMVNLVPDGFIETMDRHKVDLALIPFNDFPSWVEWKRVFQAHFKIIARKGNPHIKEAGIACGDMLPLDLYCEMGHVARSPDGNAHARADFALERVGRRRRVYMTLASFSGVYRAVSESDFLALLPTLLVNQLGPNSGLDYFDPPIRLESVEMAMVWHRKFQTSPAHMWLRDEVADLLAPLDQPPDAPVRFDGTGLAT